MAKIFKDNILIRTVSVVLVTVILMASIPIFLGIYSSGEGIEVGHITGGSFETDDFWSNGRTTSDSAFDGNYIVKGNSDKAYIYSKGVQLQKNVTYTFNFWYRNPKADSSDKIAVFYKKSSKYMTIKSLVLEQSDDWKLCSIEFKHSTYSEFYFGVQGADVEIDAASIPVAIAKSSKNIINNGSFEYAEKTWNVLGDKAIFIKGNGIDGFAAATIASGENCGIYFDFPTEKEVYYTVSFKYKGGGANASWGIARVRDEISQNDIIGKKYALETVSDWQTATTTFSSMLRDECRLIIWSGDSGEITVDDVCVTLDSSENIIKNGDFEEGFANWSKTSNGSYGIVNYPVNSGKQALKQPTFSNNSKVWQAVDVEPDTRYQISFAYAFLTTSQSSSWLKWSVCDASNDYVDGYAPATDSGVEGYIIGESRKIENTDWSNLVVTVDSGNCTRLAIAFQTASSNLVYFDDVVIKKVNVPAAIESVLKNSGFESGTGFWEQSTDTPVFFKGSVANSGAGSLKMSEHTYYPKISQTFDVEKGEKYIAIFSSFGKMGSSMWAVTKAFDKDGTPIVSVEANKRDIETGVLKPSDEYITGGTIGNSNNWKTVISNIFVPEEDDTYRITFQAHGCTKDSAFIDDVIIFKIDDDGSKLINGDFSMGEIAWAFDSEYFEFTSENYGGEGYGMNVTSGNHKTLSQSFKTEKNTNYEISFYYKGIFSDEMSAYCVSKDASFEFESVLSKGTLKDADEWTKHSFTVNSGKYNTLYLVFQTMPDSQYYIDDIKITETDKDTALTDTMVRPYFVDYHNATPYNEYPYITENNIFSDRGFESGKNFGGNGTSVLSDMTAYKGENYLHFEAAEKEKTAYITLHVKKNTTYYATLFVRYPETDGSKMGKSHISFGFADTDTEDFILTSNPDSEFGRMYTKTTQAVPVAADNEWHIISFSIKTNDAESLKFLIRGMNDTLDIDELYIFEEKDAIKYVSDFEKIEDVAITDKEPELLGTKSDTDNLLEDFDFESGFDFWTVTNSTLLGTTDNKGDLNKVNSNHSIQKNALLYKNTKRYPNRIYYIRWVDVEPHTEYTFSAKCSITEIGNGAVGIISGYRSDNYSNVTENMKLPTVIKKFSFSEENFKENCEWQNFGVSFNSKERNRVGIMVYDGGGTAYFDDFRLFKTENAVKLSEPLDNFPKTLVSTNKDYKLSGGVLTGVNENTSIKSLLKGFENSKYIRVFNKNGKEITDYSKNIGTGMQLRLMDGPVIKDRANVVIYGDVNGDGNVNSKDSTAILKHLSKNTLLEGHYLTAADVDKDGEVTVYDSMLSSKTAKSGKADFILEGPKDFTVGDEIEVKLVCNTDDITALSGKVTLTPNLIFLSAKANSEDNFYFTEDGNDIVFALSGRKTTKGDTVITFTLQVGSNEKYSGAEIILSDMFATTGKDLLSVDSYKWTNATANYNGNSDTTIITEQIIETLLSTKLSVLKLDEAKISPVFDPDIKEYTATVPYKIDKVTVTAVPEYENAVVTVGDTNLEYVGKNIVKVLVETENGGRRTYKITVRREAPKKQTANYGGLPLWVIILIIVGGVLLLAGTVTLTVILIKRKKRA